VLVTLTVDVTHTASVSVTLTV